MKFQLQKKLICLIILCSLLITIVQNQKICRVLAFQDGGDNQAYQAGALQGILETLNENEVEYDVITGVGYGSLNAAILASYEKGQEKEASQTISNIWTDWLSNDIFMPWVGGNTYGELYNKGLFDSYPLRKQIEDLGVFDHKRKIIIGATNVDTGNFDKWDENVKGKDFNQALMAALAIPSLMPYQQFKGSSYFSGSTLKSLDASSGIQKCLDSGFSQNQIVVDTIFTYSPGYSAWNEKQKTFDSLNRSRLIQEKAQAQKDYAETIAKFSDVLYRCAVVPSINLPESSYPFTFTKQNKQTMLQQGAQDAKEMCNGKNTQQILKQHYTSLLRNAQIEINNENILKQMERNKKKYEILRKVKQNLNEMIIQ